jgi:iduronate 2-sulfatase
VPEPFRSIVCNDGSFSPLNKPVFKKEELSDKEPGYLYDINVDGELHRFHWNIDTERDLLPDKLHAQWAKRRIEEMDRKPLDKPFFMEVGFVGPHTPLFAPHRFFDMFPIDSLELVPMKENDVENTYYSDLFSAKYKGPRYFRLLEEYNGGNNELGLKHWLQAYLV